MAIFLSPWYFQYMVSHGSLMQTYLLTFAWQIGYTFLPCVLAGLSNAPQYVVMDSNSSEKACIFAGDVDSVVLPIDACAGDGVLAFAKNSRNKV